MPSHVTISGDGEVTHIHNTYDSMGNKLRTTYTREKLIGPISYGLRGGAAEPQGGGISGGIPGGLPNPMHDFSLPVTEYCGNAVYQKGTLSMLLTGEGYVTFTNDTTPVYHYFLRDHLGSVRVVFRQDGTVEQQNDYYPSGALMATSTGGTVQPYKFGGKELQREAGLDEYDYGARWMDPVVGPRFTTMDPMCEKYYDVSPYAYCHGDPVNKIDPDGRDEYYSKDGKFIRHEDNETDNILIHTSNIIVEFQNGELDIPGYRHLDEVVLSAEAYSCIFTDVLEKNGFNIDQLEGGLVEVGVTRGLEVLDNTENVNLSLARTATLDSDDHTSDTYNLSVNIDLYNDNRYMLSTVSNIVNSLGVHEIEGHGHHKLSSDAVSHAIIYRLQKKHSSWKSTTDRFKQQIKEQENDLKKSY